ncbi:MAG: HAD-IIB family hydrolase [Hyphomicrobiaceae bacterium]|nr:HAD-IIB family hydrolase [Hyphomicrobiaceae bacterium]
MEPLRSFPVELARNVRAVLSDIDDTMTEDGLLPARAYGAMEQMHEAGLIVVPVTGRPAGWCDLIARQWPVSAVVGENGAFWFSYDRRARRMVRFHARPGTQRAADRAKLSAIAERVFAQVPGSAYAADQDFRSVDVAIDFCEDVARLPGEDVDRIVGLFRDGGANAKVSSIHVNAWFGDHDKLSTSLALLSEHFGIDARAHPESVVYVGDSPNDEPMFAHFPLSVGVANVANFANRMTHLPSYITARASASGFAELAETLLAARRAGSAAGIALQTELS